MSIKPISLPTLEQLQRIDRPLSAPEYYHACIGRSPRTLTPPRELVLVIEGRMSVDFIDWQTALDQVVAMNPGVRLRLTGKRQNARWTCNGAPPGLRFVEQCDWDGRSPQGAEFIYDTSLSLEDGPTAELIIVGQRDIKVIFRALHAVMDGFGTMHVVQELFRALRGEPLLGTNTAFTDSELMRNVPAEPHWLKKISPAPLTGGVHGSKPGGTWRRITLPGPLPNLLPQIALAIAEFSRQHGTAPVRIAMPINLRRHVANLLSTMNFTSMLFLDIEDSDTVGSIKTRIKNMLNKNIETNHSRLLDVVRYIPFNWLDRLVSSTEKNITAPALFETAVLSVLVGFKKNSISCPGFIAESLYGIPQIENAFVLVSGFQGKFEICVGMANVFASHGRLGSFMRFLEKRLTSNHVTSTSPSATAVPGVATKRHGSSMKTSVLIIAHNEEQHIGRCIESLLQQTKLADEIILVVHNSTDNTLQIARQYPAVTAIAYSGPAGIQYARLEGLRRVSGDIVLCIDGDSYANDNWVEVMSELLEKGNVLVGSWVKTEIPVVGNMLNTINKYCCEDSSGERTNTMIWGASFGFWLKDRQLVQKIWGNTPELSKELKLSRHPDDYWFTFFMSRQGNLEVTNKTFVTASIKECTTQDFLRRPVENIKNVSAIRSYIKRPNRIQHVLQGRMTLDRRVRVENWGHMPDRRMGGNRRGDRANLAGT